MLKFKLKRTFLFSVNVLWCTDVVMTEIYDQFISDDSSVYLYKFQAYHGGRTLNIAPDSDDDGKSIHLLILQAVKKKSIALQCINRIPSQKVFKETSVRSFFPSLYIKLFFC